MSGPLKGLKVVDLTHVMAGPVCTLLLADLGADVIKIERPPEGDDSRHMAPPYIGTEAAAYLMVNRHKRGMVVDLKTKGGCEVIKKLISEADIVVENYRRDALTKLGLGADTLCARHPRLIWCSISGYGRTGPYADRPGFDLMAQAMGGIMSFTGEGPGRPPVKSGAPIADITAGILAALGITSALNERSISGRGQIVDTSLFEAAILHTYWQSAMAFATGVSPGPLGSAHPLDGPYQAFEAGDGWIVIGAANQGNWLRFVKAIGAAGLADDARFLTNPDRMQNLTALIETLAPHLKQRSVHEWLATFEAAGVPAAPVLDVVSMHRDPQARARGMIAEVAHTTLGSVSTIGCPIKLSRTPADLGRGAPVLGEHTRAVLLEAGYAASEVDELIAARAVTASEKCSTGKDAQ